jgi:hypothetical protein
MRGYFENSHSSKLENIDVMDKFVDKFDILILKQEEISDINKSITNNEIEVAIVCKLKKMPKTAQINC